MTAVSVVLAVPTGLGRFRSPDSGKMIRPVIGTFGT
jgi:hypothetical protein